MVTFSHVLKPRFHTRRMILIILFASATAIVLYGYPFLLYLPHLSLTPSPYLLPPPNLGDSVICIKDISLNLPFIILLLIYLLLIYLLIY